ncbi:MAG: hypothetical protein IPG38_02525 [Chitinophagaceae bacterium]|nr:hypothetical protein [Chitinophagaceae bacterium]
MKHVSIFKATALFLAVIVISASVIQCRKTGDIIKGLDRSFKGTADSTTYASFYESNKVTPSDVVPDVNDIIKFRGVQTIIHEYCATSNCHGGPIAPRFDTYAEIMKFVTPGNPEGSKLWEYLTTNDFDKAMPPVNSNHEMNTTDKSLIYNWIKNGAKENLIIMISGRQPSLDLFPAVVLPTATTRPPQQADGQGQDYLAL